MSAPVDRTRLTRRRTLSGVAVAGVGVPFLAACGDDGSDGGTASDPTPTPTSEAASPSESASASESASESAEAPAADALTQVADVPEGGGQILTDEQLVVTQPASGEFKCFTAVCTHQGCIVSSVEDGTINCSCHGSKFSIEDGSVTAGPATSPLDEVAVSVDGGAVVRS
jgi:Rieske Fe-S protein